MRYIISLILLIMTVFEAQGGTLTKHEFGYGFELNLDGDGVIYNAILPEEIYKSAAFPDIADLRVFNGDGEIVPHSLIRRKQEENVVPPAKDLPFFPLYKRKGAKASSLASSVLKMKIEQKADGSIINLTTEEKLEDSEKEIYGYLIDASKLTETPKELRIEWQGKESYFFKTVTLKSSNDLTIWKTLVAETVLARLQYGKFWIKKDTIPLNELKGKYLRLVWPVGTEGVIVSKLSAVFNDPFSNEPRYWINLAGKRSFDTDDETTVVYEYENDAFVQVNALQVQFTKRNTIIKANIKSKALEKDKWYTRSEGQSYYKLSTNDTVLENSITQIPLTSDTLWRMEIIEGGWEDTLNVPTLQLGWTPHELFFVARGEPPFILAYGNARLTRKQRSNSTGAVPNTLLDAKKHIIKYATAHKKIVLGGPEMLVPLSPSLPWKKWVLWGVLACGVTVITRMAVILYRQMREEKRG